MTNISQPRFVALVPAAGTGSRFGANLPKQYLTLAGKTILAQTLQTLLRTPTLDAVLVVLAENDPYFADSDANNSVDKLHIAYCGGAERVHSVQQGLSALRDLGYQDEDWVLVHDAARALITPQLVQTLIDALQADPVGGLLATPVADTLKEADAEQRSCATHPRQQRWLAQTPQMFRLKLLEQALAYAIQQGVPTDEASAIELLGLRPKLVCADSPNFKITYPQDLQLAEAIFHYHTHKNGYPT